MKVFSYSVLGLVMAVAACAPPPAVVVAPPAILQGEDSHHVVLQPADFEALPGWAGDRWSQAVPALLKSCERMLKLPPDQAVGPDDSAGTVRDWLGPCGAARNLTAGDDAAAKQFWESWFQPWSVTDNNRAEGTFTGYYEPEVQGSRQKQGKFTIPVLAKPNDLISVDLVRLRPDLAQKVGNDVLAGRLSASGRLDPYPNRYEIETNGLGDKAPVLLWLDDAVGAHIMQIQGSGRVRLEDGSVQRLAVAATNGQRFIGLGRILADHGKVPAGATMPVIRDWLQAHPQEAKNLMAENPRYVFYRKIEGDGPIGAQGVALTPERSMAVDSRYIPLGVPLWLDTTDGAGQKIQHVLMAQDIGAAIKGPVRGDVFWGSGEAAFQQAGGMKSTGKMWLLLPRQRTPRLAAAE